jgi:hypothetical protein
MFTAVAALSLVYPASVQAVPTTYQYTGNHFTDVSPPYTTSDFVSAMITLASPLPPNFSGRVSPTAFTLFDGVQTITNLNALSFSFFFRTVSGTIKGWYVELRGEEGIMRTGARLFLDGDVCAVHTGFASVHHRPGHWEVVGAVPDTGSTLSLMTLTLMALGLVARRFKRAAG